MARPFFPTTGKNKTITWQRFNAKKDVTQSQLNVIEKGC